MTRDRIVLSRIDDSPESHRRTVRSLTRRTVRAKRRALRPLAATASRTNSASLTPGMLHSGDNGVRLSLAKDTFRAADGQWARAIELSGLLAPTDGVGDSRDNGNGVLQFGAGSIALPRELNMWAIALTVKGEFQGIFTPTPTTP